MDRHCLAAAVISLVALDSGATTFGTDISDLWFNANEPGWGVNVIQQADTLFATFFVYDADGKPAWYVASDVGFVSNNSGLVTYSGPLYRTNGPWFGASFNPSSVGVRQVGTATFALSAVSSGTLSYDIDGIIVSKAIVRQTWKPNNLNGDFIGATVGTYSNCPGASGYVEEPAYFTVSHGGTSISITAFYSNATCTYGGSYSQNGRMGSISGTASCSNGLSGSFTAVEIEANFQALSGRAHMQSGTCQWNGRFGGLRRGS